MNKWRTASTTTKEEIQSLCASLADQCYGAYHTLSIHESGDFFAIVLRIFPIKLSEEQQAVARPTMLRRKMIRKSLSIKQIEKELRGSLFQQRSTWTRSVRIAGRQKNRILVRPTLQEVNVSR